MFKVIWMSRSSLITFIILEHWELEGCASRTFNIRFLVSRSLSPYHHSRIEVHSIRDGRSSTAASAAAQPSPAGLLCNFNSNGDDAAAWRGRRRSLSTPSLLRERETSTGSEGMQCSMQESRAAAAAAAAICM